MWIKPTVPLLRKALITIPRLSPTHSRAKICSWGSSSSSSSSPPATVECYDVFCMLQCSPDLLSAEHRRAVDHEPWMLIEAHEEGVVTLRDSVQLDTWYSVGEVIGEIEDGDESDTSDSSEWIWQAYSHTEDEK